MTVLERLAAIGFGVRLKKEQAQETVGVLRLADALADAADGAIYCVTCWDNPEQNLCAKHLDPLRSALAAYRESRR